MKLAAATASWIQLEHLAAYALVVGLLGGLLSIAALLRASSDDRRLLKANATASLATSRITVARSAGTSIPYGLAIAAGALIVMSGALP